jgi:hypothetical protein
MAHFTTYHFPPISTDSPADPRSVAAAAGHPKGQLRPLAYLLLAGFGLALGQCQPKTSTEEPAAHAPSPDSLKLETAVATPLPKFDVESPILRQLALLPASERNTAPATMRRYQLLTRRFWLAHYYTDYLLKEVQKGQPNLPVITYQLATTQGHWRVVREGLSKTEGMPPTMASHLRLMQQTEQIEHAALSDLQADVAGERPLALDAANQTAQSQVAKLLAPLKREPGPIHVRIH